MTLSRLLDHPIIGTRYFFPRPERIPRPFHVACQGATLACAYHEVSQDNFTIVHFHGNGEVVADYLPGFPELMAQLGCNCFLVEYRGYGGSSGTPQLGWMLADVQQIITAIGRPAPELVLFGRSVGSLFALKAAELFPDVAGLILESAIADPLERLLLRVRPEELGTTHDELAAELRQALDPRQIMTDFSRPTLIMHTRNDGLIESSHAERLAKWCQAPAHLEIFPNGNHNDIMAVNHQRYFALIRAFIQSLGK
jgi:pimeloyl-ACP methyl ester carboxylesterase